MSELKKRFSRRDFVRVAGATAATLPLLAACAEDPTEAPVAPDNGGETGLIEGQRGGLWLPPEQSVPVPPQLSYYQLTQSSHRVAHPWLSL